MPLPKLLHHKRQEKTYKGFERRSYSRLSFDYPLKFKAVNPIFLQELQIGKAKNISQSGLLFKTVAPPQRKSYILIDLDQKTLKGIIATDNKLVMIDHKILGKAMRIHLNLENGLFEIGVRFVHLVERNGQEVKNLLQQYNKS